ncbi:outer membrane beta-barrel protein [Flavobacterium sp.]|uniref:outer membrane beta-barrel protein n=1 Tax=Flavobacterium sp. TaxID=239 RepID=UPI00375386F7
MKKIILIALVLCAFSFANAQESKGYIGVSFGASFPSGDLTKVDNAKTGFNLGLINAGYRFTETYGMTFNWGSTAYNFSDVYGYDYTFAIGYLAIGPMFSFPLSNKIGLDLKPQIAFTTGVFDDGTDTFNTNSSTGLLLGSSINFPFAKHWGLAFNLDYLSTKFKEVDGEPMDINYKANAFNTSLGIQYKF